MNRSESINELALALSKAQGKIKGALKDAENPFFKSSYADLSSVWEAVRDPLSENGLCVTQTTEITDGKLTLITTLAHSSGQWMDGRYPIHPTKNDPQSMGSAITYARRYALAAITGVAPIDDDGEAAMDRGEKSETLKIAIQGKPTVKPTAPVCPKNKKFPDFIGKTAEELSHDELDDLKAYAEEHFSKGITPSAEWSAFLNSIPQALASYNPNFDQETA